MTVVTLEHAIAAPFCTRQLADLGARVIKVERPGVGDFARAYDHRTRGLASHFVWTNRSKESLTLDLKHPDAQDVLGGSSPSRRAGAEPRAWRGRAHGLVVRCAAREAPAADRLRHLGLWRRWPLPRQESVRPADPERGGIPVDHGHGRQACKAGNSIADIAAGMYAYTGILSALLQRGVTGIGSHVEISMLEALAEWMGFPMYYAYDGQQQPGRNGAAHATIYPYGPFKAGDGRVVMLGLQNEREWKTFCDVVLRNPALATDPRFDANVHRSEHRAELKTVIEQAFSALTAQDVIARLDEAQIANAAVNQIGDLWTHPQLHARQRFRTIDSPAGELQALLPPATIDSFDARMDAVPALGEHSASILHELGRTDADIEQLRAAGVI